MVLLGYGALAPAAAVESGYEAWLGYDIVEDADRLAEYRERATEVVIDGPSTPVLASAAGELEQGLSVLLGQEVPTSPRISRDGAVVLSAGDAPLARRVLDELPLKAEGYVLGEMEIGGRRCIVIAGQNDRGVLYGAFALLRRMQLSRPVEELAMRSEPAIPLRMINQWDNLDGSVERGYAGPSIFKWDDLPETLDPRYEDYARLLASIGINAVAINNVNAGKGRNIEMLTPKYLDKAAALAEVFGRYGVKLYLSVGFNSPRSLGGLETADPLDPEVRRWWKGKADEIYEKIPDFGGFLVKADSEGQPGPYGYGRNHADGANMLAEALAPHGGLVIWRAFVYQSDGTDRSSMAYDHFKPLDGQFAENVIIQIKNGPLDFQVREPLNPLFGAMPATNVMLELQITQEYTGHDVHLAYLVPMWKQVFDFDTHAEGEGSTVRKVVDGSLHDNPHSGVTAVLNIGGDPTWLGHHLHMANFYGYGRLAWNPDLSASEITEEWARLTFGRDEQVVETIVSMLSDSWEIYERYTSPMGLNVLHDPGTHFGPMPHIRHRYHRADSEGVGFDRTSATGSGYVDQYHPPMTERYEQVETTPGELLLFFHHLPYTHRLDDGKTLIQSLYDSYFDGVEQAKGLRERWTSLEDRIDDERYQHVLDKLTRQVEHAAEWRDTMTLFFHQLSGIPDEHNRIRSEYRLRHKDEHP